MTQTAPFLSHSLLTNDRLSHGFFTRQGGVSRPPYDSLNIGLGSKDNPDHVRENRARVAATFGQTPERLLSLYQVHSSRVVFVDGPWADANARPEADGLVTRTPNLIISALSADCGPVLLADTINGVIGACHAGWKGALFGVIENTIAVMEENGAKRDHITAVVGPCIGQASYEVSDSFEAEFLHEDADSSAFFIKGQTPDKRHFDLPNYCLMRLKRADIGACDITDHDTCADEARFFSNRRAFKTGESDYGRLISAIMLRA